MGGAAGRRPPRGRERQSLSSRGSTQLIEVIVIVPGFAKLNGVTARVIQETLERPPFGCFTALDTKFYRLRKRLIEDISEGSPKPW
jgi:hypothetical protein